MRVRTVTVGATALLCALATMLSAASVSAAVASPTVSRATGGGGKPVLAGFTAFDPAVVGYEQSEVFLSGTASAYDMTAPANNDGKIKAVESSTAPYKTRAVVMRPINKKRFNGTVIVEWLNVSGGADAGPDWMLGHNELIREGFVWVGVSAQIVGINALQTDDPVRGDAARYADLSHPGDEYSYDIFGQAGQAIRDNARKILGGLKPKHLIAIGESQSEGRLLTYIDAVHPLDHVYDGFLVHSWAGGPPFRDDVGVPVLGFQTETDVSFSNGTARQPDTDMYRLWEIAGTAHYDTYGLVIQGKDTGDGKAGVAMLDSLLHPTSQPSPMFDCGAPINTGQAHYVLDAAFSALNKWVAKGVLPPKAPRIETTTPFAYVTDDHGNVRGGVRTPAVDAPVATLSGRSTGGAGFCFLFGSTVPFDADQLHLLYPNHRTFVDAWTQATNDALHAGFLVKADAKELIAAAKKSDIGK